MAHQCKFCNHGYKLWINKKRTIPLTCTDFCPHIVEPNITIALIIHSIWNTECSGYAWKAFIWKINASIALVIAFRAEADSSIIVPVLADARSAKDCSFHITEARQATIVRYRTRLAIWMTGTTIRSSCVQETMDAITSVRQRVYRSVLTRIASKAFRCTSHAS